VRDGDDYVVTGAKTFITSGCRADWVLTAVRTGGPGHGGISFLVIERGTPGFTVSKKLRKTGWWASDTAELAFDGCRVPVGNRIGGEHGAFPIIMSNFASERLMLAGQCVAIAELAYREARRYAREREAFGKPLAGFQVTRHKLADMATRIAAIRALTGEAAVRVARGEFAPALCAMAKNAATDMCSSSSTPRSRSTAAPATCASRGRAPLPRRPPLPDRRRHPRDHERDHLQGRGLLIAGSGVGSGVGGAAEDQAGVVGQGAGGQADEVDELAGGGGEVGEPGEGGDGAARGVVDEAVAGDQEGGAGERAGGEGRPRRRRRRPAACGADRR
jgi:hypothetical protein